MCDQAQNEAVKFTVATLRVTLDRKFFDHVCKLPSHISYSSSCGLLLSSDCSLPQQLTADIGLSFHCNHTRCCETYSSRTQKTTTV
eukprot:4760259-Amphidinium_carterae.1